MLGLGHHALRLRAANFRCAHLPGKKRIFTEGVVAARESNVAVDVDERLKHHIDSQRPRLAPNHRAVRFGIFGTESRGHAHRCRFGLARNPGQHSRRSIGKSKRRNVQAQNAGQVSGLTLIHGRVFNRAANQIHFFFQRHLLQQPVDARFVGLFGRYRLGPGRRIQCEYGDRESQPFHSVPKHRHWQILMVRWY